MAEKKTVERSRMERRAMIEPRGSKLSIVHQCELLGLCRSGYYYEPAGESPLNLHLMRMIDEQYMLSPFFGSRQMRDWLNKQEWLKQQDIRVNRKRIQRLMRQMGIQALYPKRKVRRGKDGEHKVYPYLLRDVSIERVDQVWSTDITYIPMQNGFMYLVAVLDWYSRYVLSWVLSNTMDVTFCLEALEIALATGRCPEYFNTDQGSQFTSLVYTGRLEQEPVKISMDGRGRCFDNIFIERLWRSVKYEDIYLKDYDSVPMLYQGLDNYFRFYNGERPHQALKGQTPAEVYHEIL